MLAFQVQELLHNRRKDYGSYGFGLCFGGFFLGFFLPTLFLLLFWRVTTLFFFLLLLRLRLLFLLLFLFVFLFMGFDILCLLLGFRLCFLLSLVGTNGYCIGTFLTEHVGKKGCCKMSLVVLFVISQPHTLPLLLIDFTGLEPVAVDGRYAENDTRLVVSSFGLEDVHTLDTCQLLGCSLTLEKVSLQLRLLHRHSIVSGSHLQTHMVTGFFIALLHGHEKAVDICLISIHGKGWLILWLQEHRPLASIIPQHKHFVESNRVGTADGFCNIELGKVSQFPVVELGNGNFLASEETVIRTIAQ